MAATSQEYTHRLRHEYNNTINYEFMHAESNTFHNFFYTQTVASNRQMRCPSSDEWIVCMWSGHPELSNVLTDCINYGVFLKHYSYMDGSETFHFKLPETQPCDWVLKHLVIPEQVVYIFAGMYFKQVYSEPLWLVTKKATIKQKYRSMFELEYGEVINSEANTPSTCSVHSNDDPPVLQRPRYLDPEHVLSSNANDDDE